MKAYPILIFMFKSVVPEIQMKRAKRDLHTYFHTDPPSHRVSYKLTIKFNFTLRATRKDLDI